MTAISHSPTKSAFKPNDEIRCWGLWLAIASAWILGLLSPTLHAQNYLTSTGVPSFAAPYPAEMGTVDASSGNLHLEINLGSYPQRGSSQTITANLLYDSHVWIPWNNGLGWSWQPQGGQFVPVEGEAIYVTPVSGLNLGTTGNNCDNDWIVTDSSGVQRYFRVATSVSGSQCTPGSGNASDSSGFFIKVLSTDISLQNYNLVVYAPDGTQFFSNTSNSNNPTPVAEDSNGNYLSRYVIPGFFWTTFQDTLGRTLLYPQGAGYNVSNSQNSSTVDSYTINSIAVPVKTNFQQSGVGECTSSCAVTVTKSIVLPDGSQFSFLYDCDSSTGNPACSSPAGQSAYYGELTSMTLPSGQTIVYGYSNFKDAGGNVGRWLTSKTAGSAIWSYSPILTASGGWNTSYACASGQLADGCQQVTVSRPDGSKDIDTFAINNGAWPVTIQTYDTNGATLLSTITNSWDFSNSCTLNSCASHGSQYVRKTATWMTLPIPNSNLTTKTAYSYDSPQAGNITAIKAWAFRTGTASTASFTGTPDRATYSTYAALANNNIDRPLTRTVCNGIGTGDTNCPGGGTTVSRTTVTYDSYGSTGNCFTRLTLITGVVNHDDAGFGCATTSRGNPTQIGKWVSGGSYLTTTFSYDTTGQVLTVTDPLSHSTTYSYADRYHSDTGNPPPAYTPTSIVNGATITTNAYVTQITDNVGSRTMEYYYGSGKVAIATDYNAVATYSHFADQLDRPTETTFPIGWNLTTYSSATQADAYSAIGDASASSSCGSCTHSQAVLDSLRRLSTEALVNNPAGQVNTAINYDNVNHPISVTHPNFGSTDPNDVAETYTYDGLGRSLKIIHPDNQYTQLAYGAAVTSLGGVSTQQNTSYGLGFPILAIDETGKLRQQWINSFGETLEVDEPSGSSGLSSPFVTNYSYNALGQLSSVVQSAQTRTYQYDGLGRLTQQSTPEAGSVTFSYLNSSSALCSGNSANPCTKTDARGIITTYSYDSANRLTSTSYNPSTTGSETYIYGTSASSFNIGRLSKMTDPSGSTHYSYNKAGRITALSKVISGTTYNIGYTYNAGGLLTQLTYPSGRKVQYSYDKVGHLCVIAVTAAANCGSYTGPYLTIASINYDAGSRPLSATYGNGLTVSVSYSPARSELTTLSYKSGSTTLFGLSYFYQHDTTNCGSGTTGDDGQIECVKDSIQPGRTVTYTYDALGRLLTANTAGSTGYPAWGLSETYDRYGNRTAQSVTAGSTYSSSLTVNPANNQITSPALTYDAAGHVKTEPAPFSTTYSYDGADCLTNYSGNGNAATYACDGDGMRVKKVVTGSNTVTTVFVYSGQDVIAEYDNGAVVTAPTREYIYGSHLLATITGSSSGSGGAIIYQQRDHLSPRLNTDANGGNAGEQDHFPFGELWYQNNPASSFIFTTYERDAETGTAAGLDYALARSYATYMGRFQSPDPVAGNAADPQSWNRYAYALNDPINNSDPTGKDNIVGALIELFKLLLGGEATSSADFSTASSSCDVATLSCSLFYNADQSSWGGANDPGGEVGTWGQALFNPGMSQYWGNVQSSIYHGAVNMYVGGITGGVAGHAVGEFASGFVEGYYGAQPVVSSTLGFVPGGVVSIGPASIATRYGVEVQSASEAAQTALARVQSGAPLYRTGQLEASMTGESQYWSLDNPLSNANYAGEMGMPGVRPDFVMGGTLRPGAAVITNEAAGLGANAGGGIQVVTASGGVHSSWFFMP